MKPRSEEFEIQVRAIGSTCALKSRTLGRCWCSWQRQMTWYDLKHCNDDPGSGLQVNRMWHVKSLLAAIERNLGQITLQAAARDRFRFMSIPLQP